jgi:acyl carrier protein
MAADTRSELLSILHDDLSIDRARIRDESELIGELGFDSVAFAIGMVAIEGRLGIALPAGRLQECVTFGDVVGLVDEIEYSNQGSRHQESP